MEDGRGGGCALRRCYYYVFEIQRPDVTFAPLYKKES